MKWSYHGQELRQKDPVEHSDSGAECGLARAEGFKVAELSLATPRRSTGLSAAHHSVMC